MISLASITLFWRSEQAYIEVTTDLFMTPYLFFDHNATTFLDPRVADAVAELGDVPLNPSSVHRFGREAKLIMERARKEVREALSVPPSDYEVVFASSGTEANNMALFGFPDHALFVSATEHPSVLQAAQSRGGVVIPVDKNGIICLDELDILLSESKRPPLVSVMIANNETGVIQPMQEIIERVHDKGGIVHTDAVQALGKIPVSVEALLPDMLTISSHKIGGPSGAAALVLARHLKPEPLLFGGGQERGIRPGTENVRAVHGFAVALSLAKERQVKMESLAHLRGSMESQLKELGAVIHGSHSLRLPNTSYITMPGVSYETQIIHFDLAGIAVSAGSACSSGRISASHVLQAMGVSEEAALATIRVSFGPELSEDGIDRFVRAWKALCERVSGGAG